MTELIEEYVAGPQKHSTDGPLTLETLLQHITNHIPHHVTFIAEKRAALA